MRLTSSVFSEGEKIPSLYTCQGKDINPPLAIEGVPSSAASLALIMDDPDVPKWVREDQMYVHWVVYDIPPGTTQIKENSPPPGTSGKNTSGTNRYVGPCPPDREHRYFFKLYALDTMLGLPPGATKEDLLKAMEEHILEEIQLMGRYTKT